MDSRACHGAKQGGSGNLVRDRRKGDSEGKQEGSNYLVKDGRKGDSEGKKEGSGYLVRDVLCVLVHLYINSHNSDPLWVKNLKKIFWIPPPGNHEKPIKSKKNQLLDAGNPICASCSLVCLSV